MNPDKLFDYLDGKLSASERADLEERLATDSQLQRELAVARAIHQNMHDSREVFAALETRSHRGAVLGRRIMIAFAALVFVNVVFGIYAIAFMEKKRRARPSEEKNRQQIAQQVEKTAESALPTPSLDVGEIKLNAPAAEQNALATKVIAAAEQCGGSGTKGLADAHGILLFAEVPTTKLADFRERLKNLGAILPAPNAASSMGEKAIVQIRIGDTSQP